MIGSATRGDSMTPWMLGLAMATIVMVILLVVSDEGA